MMFTLPPILRAALIAAAAAGCTADPEESRRLAGACQLQKCVCGPSGWSQAMAGGNVPVRWRSDGSASCPEGMMLHRVGPRPTQQ
ncbi:MAG TPA: hypothetical protein VES39_05345 [Rhodospirillales bacterium]|nr:hypothetical protein [Rhodospirillales bacterium]